MVGRASYTSNYSCNEALALVQPMIDSAVTADESRETRAQLASPRSVAPFWRQRDFWYAELAGLGARALFLVATARLTKSVDVYSWVQVGKGLQAGANPYAVTTFLNWPPFWMQVIYLLEKTSALTGLPFVACLLSFLVMVDLVLIAALYAFLQMLIPDRPPGRVVLWAISLNPVCILLTCQHGNFDGLVALSVVLFLIAVVSYRNSRDLTDWLLACLLLGIAILIKTTPIVLAPLLLLGIARLRARTVLLGVAVAVGPVLLGMSIIYVLAPTGVRENVLAYRSIPGYFGITGLLDLMNMPTLSSIYARAFPFFVIGSMLALGFWIRRLAEKPGKFVVLLAAGAMLGIPLFGPGYGSQYLYWSIPLLSAVYYVTDDMAMRPLLLVTYEIAAATYIIEYGFFASHGALALQEWPRAMTLVFYADNISTKGGETLVRLPLFLALLAVFGVIVREAKRLGSSTT